MSAPAQSVNMTEDFRSHLPLRYEDGPDYCTVRDRDGRDFALTVFPDALKAMESASSAGQERSPAEKAHDTADYEHGYGVGYEHGVKSQEQEITRLRERLGPRGLEVVMIGGGGHYVNEKVKSEIDQLRSHVERLDAENNRLRNALSLALQYLPAQASGSDAAKEYDRIHDLISGKSWGLD